MTDLRSPYPYQGGKRRVAAMIWERFGCPDNYVEPMFGSGAVLLSRPNKPGTETINDLNCFVCNFWRAIRADPAAVAYHADYPVMEADLHARHLWLVTQAGGHVERCKTDPDYFDAKIAGWFCWGAAQWIGTGWCAPLNCRGGVTAKLPHLGDAGRGRLHNLLRGLREAAGGGIGWVLFGFDAHGAIS